MTGTPRRTPRKRATAAKNSGKQQQRGKPFAPGRSGNPAGRPKGSRNISARLFDELGAEHAESIVQIVIRRARKGDIAAAALILRRIWPEPKGRRVALQLPPIACAADAASALAEVVGAVARGDLCPDEARAVADLIGRYSDAIKVDDLEKRVRALEGTPLPPE